ncbi:MAG: FAD/NAD(P)-binding protein [Kiritimatiellae bacterium]|jgi:sulfhydrogenase subunit gamma (sulfur reductase)|nr:FAD/NAD(P)-binding protein [Kiritimatiellia bacterium]
MCKCNQDASKTISVDSIYSPMEGTIVKTENMTETEKFFEIKLEEGKPLGDIPGQFVELSIFGIGEAPISVSSSPTKQDQSTFEIVVRNVGMFTAALNKLDVGDKIGVRGPFGRPFPIDDLKGNDLMFVAGGLGIVPLRSLINFVIDRRRDFGAVSILLGCKSPNERLFVDEIDKWSNLTDINYACTVDKADPDWKGNVGVITTLIPGVDLDVNKTYAVVVGPPIMYKFVIKELLKKGVPENKIVLSLERRMKCGLGKCGHCQINDLYVCQDGPTFLYSEIKGLEEAL